MIRRADITVQRDGSTPQPGVYVTVKDAAGEVATIYDDDGDEKANPFTTGLDGSFAYNVAVAGAYTEEFRLSLLASPREVEVIQLGHDTTNGAVIVSDFATPTGNNSASDDTGALEDAAGSAVDVIVPRGLTAYVSGATGLAGGQRITGGGELKKFGAVIEAMLLPDDEADQLWLDGVTLDGNASAFVNGNAVPGVLGHLMTAPRVTFCHFRNFIDSAVKVRDAMHGLYVGNLIEGCDENGFEIYNYAADPRIPGGATEYSGDRPRYEGGHIVALNQVRDVTRFESPFGPIVDASCIAFAGREDRGHKLVVVLGNVTEDTQHHIWTENNDSGSEADAVAIVANVGWGGLSGGTAEGIYGKAFLGLINARNAVAIGNVGRNAGNHLVSGTVTAFVKISGGQPGNEATEGVNNGLIVSHNAFEDDSGDADRTQYGIHAAAGQRMMVTHNLVKGAAEKQIHLYGDAVGENGASVLLDVACYGNMGAEKDYSWHQPLIVPCYRQSLDTTGTQTALFNPFDDEFPIPCAGRFVGILTQLSSAIAAGTLTVKTLIGGVEDAAMRVVFGAGGGSEIAAARYSLTRASLDADQLIALQRAKVQTVAAGIAGGNNASFYLLFDLGMKR